MCRKYLRGVERGETHPGGSYLGEEGVRRASIYRLLGPLLYAGILAANHPGHISLGTPSSESLAESFHPFGLLGDITAVPSAFILGGAKIKPAVN